MGDDRGSVCTSGDRRHGAAFALVDVAFGIKKLVCQCVVEDGKVVAEDVSDRIEAFEDDVQSVDMIKMTMM